MKTLKFYPSNHPRAAQAQAIAYAGTPVKLLSVWLSSEFHVQVVEETDNGQVRITVGRVQRGKPDADHPDNDFDFKDGIGWEELQEIKRQVGYGQSFAVEVYPEDSRVVDDANLRHLWVLDPRPAIGWRIP